MVSKIWLKVLVIVLLLLGIFFRFANLDSKIYWVDEVTTSLRISGYTKQEVIQKISDSGIVGIEDLQKYQRLSPEKDLTDTLNALIKSPEHAPLYFLLLRFWVQLFGSSVAVTRSLSIIFSLLALPCIYWLCWELFKSPLVGWVALTLLTVSPFYVAYAQEARPYSLWTVTILISSVALLRAIRLNNSISWVFYTVTLILGLYTSLLSLLVAIGQSIYVIGIDKLRFTRTTRKYLIAFSFGIIAFAPWLLVIFYNWHRLQDNTTWMGVPMEVPFMAVIWMYSIGIIFFDLPISTLLDPTAIVEFLIHLTLLALVGFSIYFLCSTESKEIWLFVLTLTLVAPLILIIMDLILERQGSTAPRYMIPCHLGIQLAVAYLLTHKIYSITFNNIKFKQKWKLILIILISLGIISCISNLEKSPRHQKNRNLHNIPISTILNQAKSPLLLAETKETIDIVSLSYSLKATIKIQLLTETNPFQFIDECNDIFLFNPSSFLLDLIKQKKQLKVKQAYKPKVLIPDEISLSLWTVENHNPERCRHEP